MTLIPNWQAVATRAWSVRFLLLSAGVPFLQEIFPLFQDVLPPWTGAALASLALIARFVKQEDVSGKADAS